ncbi:Pr6Pr family membrane protein [Mariniflexile gromovii]|uniref:Pr6Pr family membrane protein n=1 Tax=Mariniflexile gromovii TaxID=362523 RepID=A0ABS4BWK5_9FLAO|nr:Pr6Pr family membrane protein [Mariniflexile gromovii]MBP0904970.1 Pr6Pr family membrane protein [Mariniflexile gromovii]
MIKKIETIGLAMGWFAIITQFFLMLQNRQTGLFEMTIRFFSFFTILTNILVALYFTVAVFKLKIIPLKWLASKGTLTAITAFILIVGLVYQIALRAIWNPTGLQYIVDELLHTIIPLFMLGYWAFMIKKEDLRVKPVVNWLLYPLFYMAFIMVRGYLSGYYPYPFLNVNEIGYEKAFINISIIFGTVLGILISLLLIGKAIVKKKN